MPHRRVRDLEGPGPARTDKQANNDLFNAAVQYIHVNLLQDLSPPWIGHQFSQALPGDGVLCRYLKPTFMRWTRSAKEVIFGQKVFTAWVAKCQRVGLDLAVMVGRPLYVCTRMKQDGKMCGMLAAMSPLMEQRESHKLFLCKVCARRQADERRSVSQALPVLRLVRLYAHVRIQDKSVPMRSTPMHILVHAPKDESVWGIEHQAPELMSTVVEAQPTHVEIVKGGAFSYDKQESQNIWMYSTHFQNLEDQ